MKLTSVAVLPTLLAAASALTVPNNARRIHVYGVGTLIDGVGLERTGADLIVDPVVATLEESQSAWALHADVLMRNKPKDSADAGREEAARKLISNYVKVLRDVTNSMPRSQLSLERVPMEEAPYADQALREISRRLLGCPTDVSQETITSAAQAKAWLKTASYLKQRMQAHHIECPGRTPDMSEVGAAAMRAALDEVEGAARTALA